MGRRKELSEKQLGALQKATKANVNRMRRQANLKDLQDKCNRIKLIIENVVYKTNNYCGHTKIGSSNFYRLINEELSAERAHQFNQKRAAHSIGNDWENYVKRQEWLPLDRPTGNFFEVIQSQPFSVSEECPVLVASCDFVIRFQNKKGLWEDALLEVKSLNREENQNAYCSDDNQNQRFQLQIALQCTKIKKGFLVFVKGSNENSRSSEHVAFDVVQIVREDNFIETNKKQIINGLAKYYASCAAYPDKESQELIDYGIDLIKLHQNSFFLNQESTRRSKQEYNFAFEEPSKERCSVSRLLRKQILAKKGFRVKVGRPRLQEKLLIKPRKHIGKHYHKELKGLMRE